MHFLKNFFLRQIRLPAKQNIITAQIAHPLIQNSAKKRNSLKLPHNASKRHFHANATYMYFFVNASLSLVKMKTQALIGLLNFASPSQKISCKQKIYEVFFWRLTINMYTKETYGNVFVNV